ncbi:MAG: glycogen synthase GlgA [Thermoguttaceae bacterium]
MNILFAASEVTPFAKTGGLADVAGALPKALAELGHNVCVFAPFYRAVRNCGAEFEQLDTEFAIPVGNRVVRGGLCKTTLPGSKVAVYFVQQDDYFDRDGLYGSGGEDYGDNCERFVFFCRAVMESIELLDISVDILHSNDWQTGLLPAYLDVIYRSRPHYRNIASLHTIHNLAYQGIFWHWDMVLTGLGWEQFTYDKMEFYGKLNLLKAGILYSDGVSAVSPRYAAEIQTTAFGCGLEAVLMYRAEALRGILNGVCTETWNPAIDPLIAATYTAETVAQRKPQNKAALQKTLGLPVEPRVPLLGVVGRLAWQKGHDLICESLPTWVEKHGVQYAILGTGDPELEMQLAELARRYPHNVSVRLEFSDVLAHQIEAGADVFLMPSRYEPCGLNQMYSHLYGTLPVVHATGGLADTVVDANDANIAAGTANGFSFQEDSLYSFNTTLWRALRCYWEDRDIWMQLVKQAMKQDWSWNRSARQYVAYYNELQSEHEA